MKANINNINMRCIIELVACFMLLFIVFTTNAQDANNGKETVVLIQGEAKRVMMDSTGNILHIIKDEPHHMDGLFVDRPPIPPLENAATDDESPTTNNHANIVIHFTDNSTNINPESQFTMSELIAKYSYDQTAEYVLSTMVNVENDQETSNAILMMRSIQRFLITQGLSKNRIKWDIKEMDIDLTPKQQQIRLIKK